MDDARSVLSVGDEVEAKFIGVDRKKRIVSLSVKAKENDDDATSVQDYSRAQSSGGATLGDMFPKEQMENQE